MLRAIACRAMSDGRGNSSKDDKVLSRSSQNCPLGHPHLHTQRVLPTPGRTDSPTASIDIVVHRPKCATKDQMGVR